MVSFFEIYGGRCYDLLNNKNKLNILEDKNSNVALIFFNFYKQCIIGPNPRFERKSIWLTQGNAQYY